MKGLGSITDHKEWPEVEERHRWAVRLATAVGFTVGAGMVGLIQHLIEAAS